MTPSPHSMAWIVLALAVLVGGVLALIIIGLTFLRILHLRSTGHPMGTLWGRIEARAAGARTFVEVDYLDVQQTLTIQAVLQRGWSPELMERVLGRPDYAVLDPQRRQEPVRLYDRKRVERAERGKQFRAYQAEFAATQANTEARIRKWVELRRSDTGGSAQARRDG